jgi:pimeloyl-ACP methyl ester carboxylesterase
MSLRSKTIPGVLLLIFFGAAGPSFGQSAPAQKIPYGDNAEAGHYVVLNGVRLYYEVYGTGEPLVLLHGNGGNIAYMAPQIEYFCGRYKVIAVDCRGRGKSQLGDEPLTFMQMTRDIASLLDSLHLDSAYYIGRSDGGILGLMMGIYYPAKTKKIAAFGANLWPDTTALFPNVFEEIHTNRVRAEEMLARKDATQNWRLVKELNALDEFQPHISADDLRTIRCPVLVMSSDRDMIREEHTLAIYKAIPHANLSIFPGESHWVTKENPELFNSTVARFFSEPFKGDELRIKK